MSGVLLAALLLPVSRSLADDLDDSRRKLQQIERRLRQTSQTLEQKTQAERQLRSDLRSVSAELERMRRRDKDLERELGRIEETIAARQKDAAEARTQVGEMENQVKTRLVALYKAGDAGPLRIVFSSTTPSEMARQFRYLSGVVRHDRQLLDTYRSRLEDL
nr:hypothetical protein [Desulfuromonadales bacterium]